MQCNAACWYTVHDTLTLPCALCFRNNIKALFADRTAHAVWLTGYWIVLTSVCLSVTMYILALRVGVAGFMYRCFPRRALPIHFFKHFCCTMYRSDTTHCKKPNRRNVHIWNSHGQREHVTKAIPEATFSAFFTFLHVIRRREPHLCKHCDTQHTTNTTIFGKNWPHRSLQKYCWIVAPLVKQRA